MMVQDKAHPKKDISATRGLSAGNGPSIHAAFPIGVIPLFPAMTADRMPTFLSAQHGSARAKTSLTTDAQTSWTRPPEQ